MLMLKKLTVALLVLLVSLGAAITVYGTSTNQTVKGRVNCTLENFSGPDPITSTDFTMASVATGGSDNTDDTSGMTIQTNCPYQVQVKSTPDAYMTGNDSNSTDLGNKLEVEYNSNSDCTSVDQSLGANTNLSTSDQTLLKCAHAPGEETPFQDTDVVQATFTQTSMTEDPAYEGTTRVLYSITIVWTGTNYVG